MIKAAIIVLTYNSLEVATRPCLESVFRAKTDLDFQLVLVDNCSTDATREYLHSVAGQHENVSLILNDTNTGFAAGNNVGIRAVDAEYYVLLNSDTMVTDYWLDGLISFLDRHSDVGMAGPVSNAVSNEQIIAINATDEIDIIGEGLAWTNRCHGDFFYTRMLGFFCVVIRKEVIDRVGLLDEAFGLGMYEDDDYCYRVLQGGYKLACVEDVFVYHKGSVSFRNAELKDLNEIIHKNRQRFEEKHGVKWRSALTPPPFLTLIEAYMAGSEDNPGKALAKIANKLQTMKKFYYPATNDDIDSLSEQLTAIYASHTWKITAKLNRLFGRFPALVRWYKRATGAGDAP